MSARLSTYSHSCINHAVVEREGSIEGRVKETDGKDERDVTKERRLLKVRLPCE